MPTNRLGAVEPGVEYAIDRERQVCTCFLHTHIHTELKVAFDVLILVFYMFLI